MEESDDDASTQYVIFTAKEIMKLGLVHVHILYTRRRIKRAKTKRNIERCVGHFGSTKPLVVAQVWEDLQRTRVLRGHCYFN